MALNISWLALKKISQTRRVKGGPCFTFLEKEIVQKDISPGSRCNVKRVAGHIFTWEELMVWGET